MWLIDVQARRARALYIGTLEGNMVEGDKIASMHAIVEILLGKFLPQAKRNPLLLEGPINNVNEVVKDFTLFSLSKDQMEDNGPGTGKSCVLILSLYSIQLCD